MYGIDMTTKINVSYIENNNAYMSLYYFVHKNIPSRYGSSSEVELLCFCVILFSETYVNFSGKV
jgi:hypothetical protein